MPESQGMINHMEDVSSDVKNMTSNIKRYTKTVDAIYVAGGAKTTLGTADGPYSAIYVLRAGNITSITATALANSTNFSSATTIPANDEIRIKMEKIKFTSVGTFMVYKWT